MPAKFTSCESTIIYEPEIVISGATSIVAAFWTYVIVTGIEQIEGVKAKVGKARVVAAYGSPAR